MSGKTIDQSIQFVSWMISATGPLSVAAARYGATGRVERVEQCRTFLERGESLPRMLPWLRYKNAHCHNIWIRPCEFDHPFLLLDDLPPSTAVSITRKYFSAAVETSPGNCQVWIRLSRSLSRDERTVVSRALCYRIGSDPGAISEPRWGRLPGFRQRKPGKCGWTNLLEASSGLQLDPKPYLALPPLPPASRGGGAFTQRQEHNKFSRQDESVCEFAFAINALRAGVNPCEVEKRIADHVLTTGRRKGRDYARRTVAAAMARL